MEGMYEPLLAGELEVGPYSTFAIEDPDALTGHHVLQWAYLANAASGVVPHEDALAIAVYQPRSGDVFYAAGRKNGRHYATYANSDASASQDPETKLSADIDKPIKIYAEQGIQDPKVKAMTNLLRRKNQMLHKTLFM